MPSQISNMTSLAGRSSSPLEGFSSEDELAAYSTTTSTAGIPTPKKRRRFGLFKSASAPSLDAQPITIPSRFAPKTPTAPADVAPNVAPLGKNRPLRRRNPAEYDVYEIRETPTPSPAASPFLTPTFPPWRSLSPTLSMQGPTPNAAQVHETNNKSIVFTEGEIQGLVSRIQQVVDNSGPTNYDDLNVLRGVAKELEEKLERGSKDTMI